MFLLKVMQHFAVTGTLSLRCISSPDFGGFSSRRGSPEITRRFGWDHFYREQMTVQYLRE